MGVALFKNGDRVWTAHGEGEVVGALDELYLRVHLDKPFGLWNGEPFHVISIMPMFVKHFGEGSMLRFCEVCEEDMLWYTDDYQCAWCRDQLET